MSLSSNIHRQSQKNAGFMNAIAEEAAHAQSHQNRSTGSVKAKRRLGVSDLRIPRTSQFFLSSDPADWRLTLPGSPDTFDFPRPPPFDDDSTASGSGSSSSSTSGSDSSAPTTPAASPTSATHSCVARCKTIKPLTIVKRAVSPLPSSQVALEDDDEFYAAHARAFITLSPRLPPSFPTSPVTSRARRESLVLPAAPPASVRLSRTSSIRARTPPPPPPRIITSCAGSPASGHAEPATPRQPARPPPRTPLPTDALSGDYGAYAPLLSALSLSGPAPAPLPSRSPSPRSSTPVPQDVRASGKDWARDEWFLTSPCDEEAPLSPLIAPAPCPSAPPSPISEYDDAPSPIEYALPDSDTESAHACTPPTPPPKEQSGPRSRWSFSSEHVHSPAPSGFALRRYFRSPSPSPSPSPPKSKSSGASGSREGAAGKDRAGATKRARRLTPADVLVITLGLGLGGVRASSSTSSSSASASRPGSSRSRSQTPAFA
ncbi:hypothetical protein B0H17DRAFT_1074117 [Mycena rosella]|uniref:Uncharacterized protein n=1 Tax=Mycena rosella TaxID=1033263 RepID=A0AAD7D7P7_MYCRO|nr:hypothetical protein B0H17DRAFT_1074117 [Mycena rosella]